MEVMDHDLAETIKAGFRVLEASGPTGIIAWVFWKFRPTIERIAEKVNSVKISKIAELELSSEGVKEQQRESNSQAMALTSASQNGFRPSLHSAIRRKVNENIQQFLSGVQEKDRAGMTEEWLIEFFGRSLFYSFFVRMSKSQFTLLEQLYLNPSGMSVERIRKFYETAVIPASFWKLEDFSMWIGYLEKCELLSVLNSQVKLSDVGSDFVEFCKSNSLEMFAVT